MIAISLFVVPGASQNACAPILIPSKIDEYDGVVELFNNKRAIFLCPIIRLFSIENSCLFPVVLCCMLLGMCVCKLKASAIPFWIIPLECECPRTSKVT